MLPGRITATSLEGDRLHERVSSGSEERSGSHHRYTGIPGAEAGPTLASPSADPETGALAVDVRVGPALVTRHLDDRVLVCEPDASMSRDAGQGFFAADTRFVSGYRLRLGGTAPVLLSSAGVSSFGARFEFTNPELNTALGALAADTVHLRLERSLGGALHEDYDLVNFGPVAFDVTMEVSLECDFGDISPTPRPVV